MLPVQRQLLSGAGAAEARPPLSDVAQCLGHREARSQGTRGVRGGHTSARPCERTCFLTLRLQLHSVLSSYMSLPRISELLHGAHSHHRASKTSPQVRVRYADTKNATEWVPVASRRLLTDGAGSVDAVRESAMALTVTI